MTRPLVACCVAWLCWTGSASAQTADDLFDEQQLHDVAIYINGRDWQELRVNYLQNTYYPCDVEWRGTRVRNAACRSRGNGTRNGVKPGLKIEFDHYVSGQRFLGLTSIVLDNHWQDASMLRETLAMRLFREMGVPAPREAHARLFLGATREFLGLYAVVEDLDAQFVERHYGRGGYLYEYRWIDRYYLTDLGANLEPYAARFEARTRSSSSAYALYAPVRDLVRAIADAGDGALAAAIAPWLNLDRTLTYMAIENFLADIDGFVGDDGINNFYYYRRESGGGELIPWDKDYAMRTLEVTPWHNVERHALAAKVWAAPELRQAYLAALLEVTGRASWLPDELERQYRLVREAAVADTLKPISNDEFEAAIAQLRVFARDRASVVRTFVRAAAGPTRAR